MNNRKILLFRWIIRVFIGMPIILFLLLWGTVNYWEWDENQNRGYHHGYWGEYNRIRDALTLMAAGTAQQTYLNKDITLEEFGFSVVQSGKTIRLDFDETNPIRRLKGDKLIEALKTMIQEKMSVQQAGPGYPPQGVGSPDP